MQLSIQDCTIECLLRRERCQYIVHNRLYVVCSLCEKADGREHHRYLVGDLVIAMNYTDKILEQMVGGCSNISCSSTRQQKCGPASGKCVYSECDIPQLTGAAQTHLVQSGIGSKLKYDSMEKRRCILECLPDATWRNNMVNIALNKTANQSSTMFLFSNASLAVDGNRDKVFEHTYCSHTKSETRPWWMVDLENVYPVNRIKIVNRSILGERLHDLNITVTLGDEDAENKFCTYFGGPGKDGQELILNCTEQVEGRYVKIQEVKGLENYLTLCEVEILVCL